MGNRGSLDGALLDWLDEFANQGIVTTDSELIVSGWNRWLEIHSGRSTEEMIGRNLLEAYPELAQHHFDRFYRDALAGQAAVLAQRFHRYLLPIATPGGRWQMMQQSARIAPLFAGDEVVGTITVIEDVTDRVEREEDLRRSRDELEVRVEQRTAQLANAREQLQHLSRRLIEIQENERRAIARELHDETGQALTALLLGLRNIEQKAGNADAVIEQVRILKEMTGGVMEGIHRLAINLRPATLDRLGLVPALRQYVEDCQHQSGIAIDLVSDDLDGPRLAPEVEVTLYRVVQEALTNVLRHSGAQNVGVVVHRERDHVHVIVEDDGIGFDVQSSLQNGRLGVVGMRERAEMLGGSLTIESSPATGTTVFVEIPVPDPQKCPPSTPPL